MVIDNSMGPTDETPLPTSPARWDSSYLDKTNHCGGNATSLRQLQHCGYLEEMRCGDIPLGLLSRGRKRFSHNRAGCLMLRCRASNVDVNLAPSRLLADANLSPNPSCRSQLVPAWFSPVSPSHVPLPNEEDDVNRLVSNSSFGCSQFETPTVNKRTGSLI